MTRVALCLVFVTLLSAVFGCDTSPSTPTVTFASVTPILTVPLEPSATVLPPTATPEPTTSAPTRTPFPPPRIRIGENGLDVELRYSAIDIAVAATGGAYAWAWEDWDGVAQKVVYPGLMFLPAGDLLGMRHLDANQPTVLAVESQQERVVTGSIDGEIEIWNARTGMRDFVYGQVTGKATSIALNADDSLVAVGANGRYQGGDGSVTIWKQENAEPIKVLPAYGGVTRVAFAPDGRTIYFSTSANTCARGGGGLFRWNSEMADAEQVYSAYGNAVSDFAIDPQDKYLAIVGETQDSACPGTGKVVIADLKSGKALHVMPQTEQTDDIPPMTNADSVAFSPDAAHVVVGGVDGSYLVWDWQTEKVIQGAWRSSGAIPRVLWAPQNLILMDDDDSYVRMVPAPIP